MRAPSTRSGRVSSSPRGNWKIVKNPILEHMPPAVRAFSDCGEALRDMKPEQPVHVWRPHVLRDRARHFLQLFPGVPHYAVKCNPEPYVLKGLWKAGIRAFDVASLGEVRLVRKLFPAAQLAFMHPVKSPMAIREAYFTYGVRFMVLDHADELAKIVENTQGATDITLLVRMAVSNAAAQWPLSRKFGALPEEAASLLRAAAATGCKVGLSFHVGSQCLEPAAYTRALHQAADVVREADQQLAVINVGGGFPVPMEDVAPPDIETFMEAVREGLAAHEEFKNAELWAEPGRALVAEAGAMLVRVELRKGDTLYLNDGTYGGMFEGGPAGGLRYPVKAWRNGHPHAGETATFSLYGPTCDSVDKLPGPFTLPADIRMGDWLEFRQLGAYGNASRTAFNGFGSDGTIVVSDC